MAGLKGMVHTKLKYSRKLGQQVCSLIENGNTLNQVCEIINKQTPIGLTAPTILSWRRHNEDFAKEYELSYDSRSALWTDELYSIASAQLPTDPLEMKAESARRRIIVDVLKTLLNKHRPTATIVQGKKSQESVTQEITVVKY